MSKIQELIRAEREKAALTMMQVGEKMHWSAEVCREVEHGKAFISTQDLLDLGMLFKSSALMYEGLSTLHGTTGVFCVAKVFREEENKLIRHEWMYRYEMSLNTLVLYWYKRTTRPARNYGFRPSSQWFDRANHVTDFKPTFIPLTEVPYDEEVEKLAKEDFTKKVYICKEIGGKPPDATVRT